MLLLRGVTSVTQGDKKQVVEIKSCNVFAGTDIFLTSQGLNCIEGVKVSRVFSQ